VTAADGEPASEEEVEALQGLLATEHAAAWGWEVVGARLEPGSQIVARTAVAAHLSRRDRLTSLLLDRGATPVAASAAYELPPLPPGQPAALELGVQLEDGVAAAQVRALSELESPALRGAVMSALTDAATRAARLRLILDPGGAVTAAFPGEPGLVEPLPPSPAPEPPPAPEQPEQPEQPEPVDP
jgi:hypothetical protein